MSRTEKSLSASAPDAGPGGPSRTRHREAWRELNAAQLVCIAGATVSSLFGMFGGVLIVLSVSVGVEGALPGSLVQAALIPSCLALGLALGAMVFTRSSATRRAARQSCGPAVLMGLTGLLATVVCQWLVQ